MATEKPEKGVVAFRASQEEAELINKIAERLRIPKSRVLALALDVFKEHLEKEQARGPEGNSKDISRDAILRLTHRGDD